MPTPELHEIEPFIHQWAEARGLYNNSTPIAQFAKLVEEFGETNEAMIMQDKEAIKDGFGDCVVVLTIMSRMYGHSLAKISSAVSDILNDLNIEDDIRWCYVELGRIASGICISKEPHEIASSLAVFYCTLANLAKKHGLSIEACAEAAYNEIKNRSGKMVDGVYVKD